MINATLKPLTVALLIGLTGCSQIPTYEKPLVDLPTTLGSTGVSAGLQMPTTEQQWWAQFNDPALTQWLDAALQNNADFAIADQRLRQAQAALTQGRADQRPRLDGQADAGRQQTSDVAVPIGQRQTYNQFNLGALLSYEIDLWGRVSANVQSLEAQQQAQRLNRENLRLSLMTNVAQSYFNLRTLDQMVDLAQQTVVSRQETLNLRQRQYELGSITQLTVQQAQVELSRVEIQHLRLLQQRDLQRTALSLLAGQSPAQILAYNQAQAAEVQAYPMPVLPPSIDSSLLMRRPDIQAAEQQLIAANANIGVARAALFPRLSLNGFIGLGSEALNDLFSQDAVKWQAQAGLTAPIFNRGSLQAQVDISEAEQQIKLQEYQQTLRQAFGEALDALTQQHRAQQQLDAQQRQVDALRETLRLAQTRFDSGYSSYLEVLDAQRSLFDAELALVETELSHLSAGIKLYKAIGGHWQAANEQRS
ncbi:MAG: efflux transporter outer membrane subunit [Thiomicrospira sp.]|jgi:multidrug efflux system outer membrane protein|nr:efflux transporter outer membrane subunit [Thiomicrospira sp.]